MTKSKLIEIRDSIEHAIAYLEKVKPIGCGVNDDKDCSPYNDLKESLKLLNKELPND